MQPTGTEPHRYAHTWNSAWSILTKSLEEQPGGNLPSAYAAGLKSTSGIVMQWYRHALHSTPVSLQKYFTCIHADAGWSCSCSQMMGTGPALLDRRMSNCASVTTQAGLDKQAANKCKANATVLLSSQNADALQAEKHVYLIVAGLGGRFAISISACDELQALKPSCRCCCKAISTLCRCKFE